MQRFLRFSITLSIVLNYAFSLGIQAQERVSDDLVVLYNFGEGQGSFVHDISEFGSPLMLHIDDLEQVEWLPNGGLDIQHATRINSLTDASKVSNAVQETQSLTVEAWINPANVNQDGPARIVSMSHGTGTRNFTLGQNGNEYIMRCRTTVTSENGMPQIETGGQTANTVLQHVVYTLDASGNEKMYLNAELIESGVREGELTNWDSDFKLVLANELTGYRDWTGEMYLVAMYNDALSVEEIEQNYAAGHLIAGPAYSNELCDQEECFIDGFGSDARVLWIPNLPNNVYLKFMFDEEGGYMHVFEDGTAHLYGQCVNMLDPDYGWFIDVWFTDKMNWMAWSELGRSWKGDPAIVGDNYLDWDYYIMDADKDNLLIGTGNYEGTELALSHKPSDYYYGFQVGVAANDQNALPGMSCWFYYEGEIDGEYVESNGDLNLEGECLSLPVLECPDSFESDCLDNTLPEITGEPVLNCLDYSLSYWDESESDPCSTTITRHWEATNSIGDVATCEQSIWLVDNSAPEINVNSEPINDCESFVSGMFEIIDNCDPEPQIEITVLDSTWLSGDDCDPGQLRTQTMGGWGAEPSGNNPGVYLHENFDAAFPNGLTIGCNNTLTFTSAQAITDFLPSGSTASMLPEGNMTDPGDGYNNVFAGQLVAATLSTTFDAYDPDFGESDWALEEQYLLVGNYAGFTLAEILILANEAIGSCSENNLSDLNDALSTINENYVDGEENQGNIGCELPWDCYLNYQIEVTATDACGNATTQLINQIVLDEEAPEFPEMEEFITVECGNIPNAELILPEGCFQEYTDVQSEDVEASGSCLPTVVRTWTLTDQCGNSASFTQYIAVIDTTPPVFLNAPENAAITCGDDWPEFIPEATDNCSAVVISYSESSSNVNCEEVIVRTWVATDGCGNSAEINQTVTIVDELPPIPATPLEDLVVDCNNIPEADVAFEDDCSAIEDVVFSEEIIGEGCSYEIIRNWTATDLCGNSSTYSQSILVEDSTPPVFLDFQELLTLTCNDEIPVEFPEVMDDCGTIDLSYTDSSENSDCGNISRTWIAEDACGNTAIAVQEINFSDNEAPEIIGLPADLELSCLNTIPMVCPEAIDNCDTEPTLEYFESVNYFDCTAQIVRTWVATDNCGNSHTETRTVDLVDFAAPIISGSEEITTNCEGAFSMELIQVLDDCSDYLDISYEDNIIGDGCSYDINRVWTATDLCGNSDSFEQLIHVIDESGPVFTYVPANLLLDCGTFPFIEQPLVEDACSVFDMEMIEEWSGSSCNETLTRTWIVTDDCGNSNTAVQIINFVDQESPEFSNYPENLTLSCEEIVPEAELISAVDNCSSDIEVNFTELILEGDCPGNYTIQRVWNAEDDCGNSTNHVQFIEIFDNTPPVILTSLEDAVVQCGDLPPLPDIEAIDNCSDAITIDFEQFTASGGCPNITRSWTVTDACGNSASIVQNIFVIDNEPPLILGVPEDMVADCNSVPEAPEPDVSDNCDENVDISMNEIIYGTGCELTLVRTWMATDDCGNSTTVSQSIQLIDEAPPVFVNAPSDITLSCDELDMYPPPAVVDNCDSNIDVTFTDETIGSGCSYDLIRTYTATDLCGNEANAVVTIHVIDESGPAFINAESIIYADCADIPAPEAMIIEDNCSSDLVVTFEENTLGEGCSYVINRTWTATDACGNSSSFEQSVLVSDATAPEFEDVPDNLVVDCNEVIPDLAEPSIVDNCDTDPVLTVLVIAEETACGEIIHYTWTATDNCGNVNSVSRNVEVTDLTAPIFIEVPTDVEVNCTDIPSPDMAVAVDNCTENVNVLMTEEIVSGSCPYSIIRTWTAIDACGNSSMASQEIFVTDNEAPVFLESPQDMTVNCGEIPEIDSPLVTDNCTDDIELIVEESWNDDSCLSQLIRTWTATDYCGNNTSTMQIITVIDNEAPVFNGVPENLTVECGEVPPMEILVATDNCSTVEVIMEEITSDESCASYTITRVWTAYDACGNNESVEQLIDVFDSLAPELSDYPADTLVPCNEVPPVPVITGWDACGGDVEVNYTEEVIFLDDENNTCDLGNTQAISGEVAVWLPGLEGYGTHYVFGPEGGLLAYDEIAGTAHISGEVFSTEDANQSFFMDIDLYDAMDWENWSADGGWYKDDMGYAGDAYLDWTYYKMADGSQLIGTGEFDGDVLNLTHAPADFTFGFQLGQAANNTNDAFGMSGWFSYSGELNGEQVEGIGDVITENNCCPETEIIRTWTASDCAGNTISWTQTITINNSFEYSPLNFPELPDAFQVNDNFDNTFNVSYRASETSNYIVDLLDMSGAVVDVLHQGQLYRGDRLEFVYQNSNLSHGSYLFRLRGNQIQESERKLIGK